MADVHEVGCNGSGKSTPSLLCTFGAVKMRYNLLSRPISITYGYEVFAPRCAHCLCPMAYVTEVGVQLMALSLCFLGLWTF